MDLIRVLPDKEPYIIVILCFLSRIECIQFAGHRAEYVNDKGLPWSRIGAVGHTFR